MAPADPAEDLSQQLQIVPTINSPGELTLEIDWSEMDRSEVDDAVPDIGNPWTDMKIRVPDGAMLSIGIGGLVTEDDTDGSRKETMIFLQPCIVEPVDDLLEKNIEEIRKTIFGSEAEAEE